MNDCEEYNIVAPSKPKPYAHSHNSNFIVSDLPECYFTNKLDYLNLIEMNKHDLFIIFNSNKSDQIDLWLAKELILFKKKVFFVKNYPNFVQSPLDNLVETIQVVEANQNENNYNESDNIIYLVSPNGADRNSLDFIKLLSDIMNSLSLEKAEALARSLEPFSKEIINMKHQILKSKTFYSAFSSSVLGTHRVPEMSICVDLAVVTTECWFFIQQFGLSFDYLDNLEASDAIQFEKIINCISKYEYGSLILLNGIESLSGIHMKIFKILASQNLKVIAGFSTSFQVASIIDETWAFSSTRFVLCTLLDELAKIATDLIDYQTKSQL